MIETLTSSIFLMAMGIWLGGVVFFSFFTAPGVFERLSRNQAADIISVIFPRYYNLRYLCGFAMLIAGSYPIYLQPRSVDTWLSWSLALLATVVSLYAGKVVMPMVRRLRITAESSAGTPDQGQNRERYARAHQLSMFLNSIVLFLLLVQTVIYAYRIKDVFTG